jgi:FKBP-type peptidyl-prolyl cis-trans isomerase FklB
MRIFALVLASVLLAALPARAATYDLTPDGNARYLADFAAKPGVVKLPSGVMYRVVQAGDGHGVSPIARFDIVYAEYKGWLVDGHVFDATKGQALRFEAGGVIAGWTEALMKMKTGDEWQVVIPAKSGYGADGRPPVIPPDQTLVFLIKLEKVEYP